MKVVLAGRPFGRVGLGDTHSTSAPGVLASELAVGTQTILGPARGERSILALATLATGLGSFVSLMLFATGNTKAGYAFGAMTALVGASVGAVRVYTELDRG